jgi:hypothetical protein
VHLCFKFLQICVFIFMGAASANWNPARLINLGQQDDLGIPEEGEQGRR